MTNNKLNISAGRRLLLLLCLMAMALLFTSIIIMVLPGGGSSTSWQLASICLQDILVFIMPALAIAWLCYDWPWHFLCIDKAPSWKFIAVAVVFFCVSLPMMNWMVEANKSIHLPQCMSGVEQWMLQTEEAAAKVTEQILNAKGNGYFIATVVVVGLMAGLSEETLFRGIVMQTMRHSRWSDHAAVWVTAIVFSAFHMQFFGFVPRMLLGAWLGYLLVWSRSLWVPIIAHALNNSMVVLATHLENQGTLPEKYFDTIGLPADGQFPWLALASTLACVALAVVLHRKYRSQVAQEK